MTDTRRLRRVQTKSRADDTRNIYRRYQLKNGKEEPVPAGRATAFVVILNHKGRQFRRFAPTQAAAIRVRAQLRQLLRDGIDPEGQLVSFAAYADEWIGRYKGQKGGIRAETKREYTTELELAKAFFQGRKLTSIKRRDAENYVEHVRATRGKLQADGSREPSADGTIRNAIAPLRSLFFDALQNEIVRSNPFARLPVSAVVEEEAADTHDEEKRKPKHLEPDELRRFLDALAEPPKLRPGETLREDWSPGQWPLLGEFLAQTGLRISEAVALRWRDVDLHARTIEVRWRIYRQKRGRPKSENGIRTVPLSPGVAEKLAEHQRTTPFSSKDDPVFASRKGTHLAPGNVYRRVFKPAFVKAGVPWAGFHSLRHTAASFYARPREAGGAQVSITQLSRLLGHHSASFTLTSYVGLFEQDELTSNDVAPFDVFVENGSKNGSNIDRHRPARPKKGRQPKKRTRAGISSTRA